MGLEGKVGVVTGSAKGIGYGIAEALLQKGAKVCVSDIDEEVGEETVRKFNEKYGKGKAIFVKCDVTSELGMENLFAKVKTELGLPYKEKWELMIQINLTAVIRGTKMAMECMSKEKAGNGGVILNVASLAGLHYSPAAPLYTATKHGVVAATRSIAAAKDVNEKNGLKFVTLCPSYVETLLLEWGLRMIPEVHKAAATHWMEQTEGFLT